jgi:hypothetical protein
MATKVPFIVAQAFAPTEDFNVFGQAERFAAKMYGDAKSTPIDGIASFSSYKTGNAEDYWMPVGTVEFCRAVMQHHGVQEPSPLDYPDSLQSWEPRRHSLIQYKDLPAGWTPDNHMGLHAKPMVTKLDSSLWEPSTPFWSAPYFAFTSEWRVYVINKEIVGVARYDDEDAECELNMGSVAEMVRDFDGSPAGYGLDVGTDVNGRVYLVEVNDGWALGLYKGTCSYSNYLNLLKVRWLEIGGCQ